MYQLQKEMTYLELNNWMEYFKRRPAGWADDLRASYIMQSMGSKAKGNEIFPSLDVIYKEAEENDRIRVERIKKNAFIKRFVMPMFEENQDGE